MASDNFGLKIGLEGEKEFKSQLAEINGQFKVLASEMKLVDSEFAKNDTSVQALTARNEVLNKQIAAQKQKVEVLKAALENAAKSFGETDKRTLAWKEKLNLAQASLNSMEKEVKENNEELKKETKNLDNTSKSAKGMSKSIDEAGDESEQTGKQLKALGAVAGSVAGAMTAAFAAMTATIVAVGKKLISFTNESSEFADAILTESKVTGIATDKLQGYYYAAELMDVSVDALTGSMKKNISAMASAAKGSASAVEAYAALGVSFEDADGNLRDSEDVYWDVIEALGKVENETERDALAMTLLGKSATELNPLIEAGKDGLEALCQEAEDVGYVMSKELLDSYGEYNDACQRLTNSTTSAKHALGTILLPVLTTLANDGTDLLNEFSKGIMDSNGDISKMGKVLSSTLPKLFKKILSYLPDLVKLGGEIIGSLAGAILDNLPMIIETASEIIFSLLNGLVQALPQITSGALQLLMALTNGLLQNLPMILEAAIQMVVTLALGIADALPTLVPTVIQVIMTLVTTLTNNLPLILDAALQLIIGLATGILAAIPELIKALPALITSIITFLISSIPQLIEAGVQLFMALITNMPAIIMGIIQAIPQIITAIVDGFKNGFSRIKEVGENLLKGVWEGISNTANWLVDKIKNWAGGLVDKVKSFFGIHSPSKVFAEIGGFMGEGLSDGFTDSMKEAEDDMVKSIPHDFDIDASIGDIKSSAAGGNAFNVTIPLTLEGKTLAKVIAEIQWTQNAAFVRNLG